MSDSKISQSVPRPAGLIRRDESGRDVDQAGDKPAADGFGGDALLYQGVNKKIGHQRDGARDPIRAGAGSANNQRRALSTLLTGVAS